MKMQRTKAQFHAICAQKPTKIEQLCTRTKTETMAYEVQQLQNEVDRKFLKLICLCSEYYICTFIISFKKMYLSHEQNRNVNFRE